MSKCGGVGQLPSNSALPAYEGEEDYVFICYSHADSTIYAEIRMLQDQGINVWYDSGITPGSEWTDTLARRIQGCTLQRLANRYPSQIRLSHVHAF